MKIYDDGWVYARSLSRKLGTNILKLPPDKSALVQRLPPLIGERMHRVQWFDGLVEKLSKPTAPMEPFNVWLVDYRTIVHPLDRVWDDLELRGLTSAQATRAMELVFWLQLHPPGDVVSKFPGKWLVVVADDGSAVHPDYPDPRKPVYWRHVEALRTSAPFTYKDGRKNKSNRWYRTNDLGARICKHSCIPILKERWFEADDVIGYLASTAPEHIKKLGIYTVDSDLLQLVDEEPGTVFWYNVNRHEPRLRWAQESLEYWQRREKVLLNNVREIVQHKATHGDRSDSIPPNTDAGFIDLLNPMVPLPLETRRSFDLVWQNKPRTWSLENIRTLKQELLRLGVIYGSL